MPTETKTIECREFPGTWWETGADNRSVIVRLLREPRPDEQPKPGETGVEIAMRKRLFADGLVKRGSDGNTEVSQLDPLDLTARLMKEIIFTVRSYEHRH